MDQQQYYMVVNEQQAGPFTLEEIIAHSHLSPETLVWKPGYDNWLAAKNFPELEAVFANLNAHREINTPPDFHNQTPAENPGYQEQNQYQNENPYQGNGQYQNGDQYQGANQYGGNQYGGNQYGGNQSYQGQNPNNQNGYNQDPYLNRQRQPENQNNNNRFANNPQYQSNQTYRNNDQHHHNHNNNYHHQHQNYQNPNQNRYQQDIPHTNWLPWAIVTTVVSIFTNCLALVFGIIAIVQANKANNCYAQGKQYEGDSANSNAKIMTIIGLVLIGLAILSYIWFGSMLATMMDSFYSWY